MPNPVPDSAEIGARIATARDELGLTQAELGRQINLDRTGVAKIEAGTRKVSASELVQIAAALDRPIDWFVVESPPAIVSRRQDAAVGGHSIAFDRLIERLARDVQFLERDGILPAIDRPRLQMPSSADAAEAAAAEARQLMSLGDGPVHDLQRASEGIGLLAFALDVEADGGDAAYVSLGDWGVALINGAIDPGRRRFNLAHELGHFLFDDAYGPEISIASAGSESERIINAFAVHLLLPWSFVSRTWEEFADHRLAAIAVAVRGRVSWSAVCAHLKNLGFVDETERSGLAGDPPGKTDFMELGERWVSELDAPSTPPDYGRRVLRGYRTGRLSMERAIELLWGEVTRVDMPTVNEIPLEALRREFDPLP
jgi:Zn-dependent peptidase ImmA (M78 family)/transcriptional regulator with XRE-family HTH domain